MLTIFFMHEHDAGKSKCDLAWNWKANAKHIIIPILIYRKTYSYVIIRYEEVYIIAKDVVDCTFYFTLEYNYEYIFFK